MRLSATVLFGILAGCKGASIRLGDGAAANPATPQEAYAAQLDLFQARSARMRQLIFHSPSQPDLITAAAYCQEALAALEEMKKLTGVPTSVELQLPIDRYRRLLSAVKGSQPMGTELEIESWEQDVKKRFGPNQVTLASAGKVEPVPANGGAVSPSTTSPPSEVVPAWVSYYAWKSLHRELEARWTGAEDCQETLDRLYQVLSLLGAASTPEKASKVVVYTDFYRRLQEETRGFRDVPKGGTKDTVLNELRAVAGGIELNFKPSR